MALPIDPNTSYSSYRERLIEHIFVGEVMKHLWLEGLRVDMLKPQVDDGGYDIVLEHNSVIRHIQLKSSHLKAATPRVPVQVALCDKPSGCVVWIQFDQTTMDLGPFLWFGRMPGEPMADISEEK